MVVDAWRTYGMIMMTCDLTNASCDYMLTIVMMFDACCVAMTTMTVQLGCCCPITGHAVGH